MNHDNTGTVNKRGLPDRCHSYQMLIPKRLDEFEKNVKTWISTCVASRTITPSGAAIRREIDLVDGNRSLRQVWEKVKRFGGTTDFVIIEANYNWSNVGQEASRVNSIRFSTKTEPPLRDVPAPPNKPKIPTETIQAQWKILNIQLNRALSAQYALEKEVERLQGFADENKPTWLKAVETVTTIVSPGDATDRKVEMRSKRTAERHRQELLNDELSKLDWAKSQVQFVIHRIKSVEAELFLMMGEKAFKAWFKEETKWHKSPFYPKQR